MKTFPLRMTREGSLVWLTGADIQMALNFLSRYSPHHGWTPNMLPLGKLHDTYNKQNE